jgi:hypothetical protein
MYSETTSRSTTIRATCTSYFILSGVWILLAIGYFLLSIRSPGRNFESGALIAGGVGMLWCVWLRGFKITVSDQCVEYRDGFFRSSRVALSEIADIRNESTGWSVLGQKFGVPRIIVVTENKEKVIRINPKPFGRIGLQRVLKKLRRTKAAGHREQMRTE